MKNEFRDAGGDATRMTSSRSSCLTHGLPLGNFSMRSDNNKRQSHPSDRQNLASKVPLFDQFPHPAIMHSRLWLPAFPHSHVTTEAIRLKKVSKRRVSSQCCDRNSSVANNAPKAAKKKLSCNPEKMAENTTFDSWQGPSTYRAASDAAAPSLPPAACCMCTELALICKQTSTFNTTPNL